MGQQEEAVRLMKDAVAKSPEVPTLNYHLGMAFYQTGNTAEARAYLSKALKSAEAFQGREEAEQIMSQMRG
jgi:Flp pilus assembly protein TadD